MQKQKQKNERTYPINLTIAKYKLKRGQYFTTNCTSRTHTHRGTLRPLQRPHGTRVRGWTQAHTQALLHQLGVHWVCPIGANVIDNDVGASLKPPGHAYCAAVRETMPARNDWDETINEYEICAKESNLNVAVKSFYTYFLTFRKCGQ